MRITAGTIYRDASAALERASGRLLTYQEQVSSGARIQRPSDDPTGAANAIGARAELASIAQYQRTADSVSSRLTIMDTALSDIVERLSDAQGALVGARGSTKTDTQRESAAQTLEGIRQALFEDLNTSFHGVFLFAGANAADPPYLLNADQTVSAYQGSTREVQVDVDTATSVTIGVDGMSIAGTGAADIFTALDALIAAVRADDDDGMAQGDAALQAAFGRATSAQSRVGTSMAAVANQQTTLTTRQLAVSTRVATIENVDMASAINNLNQAETTYRAALAATGALTQASLMDYLS